MRNIINITIKNFKINLKDKRAMIMMTIFPIVLIMILGAALSSSFSSTTDLGTINVGYKIEKGSKVEKPFIKFLDSGKALKVNYYKNNNIKNAVEKVKKAEYGCFVYVSKKNIYVYNNNKFALRAQIYESMLNTFIDKCNIVNSIAKVSPIYFINPQNTKKLFAINDYTKIGALKKNKKPGALDYYAVTMTTLIIMYGAYYGLAAITTEYERKTQQRTIAAPVKKYQVFTGTVLGVLILTMFQILLVFLVSKYGLKAYWGDDIVSVMAVLAAQVVFSISFGVGLAFIVKDGNQGAGIISFAVPVMALLAGAYVPINTNNKIFEFFAYLFPIKWSNKSLFQIIYYNDYSMFGKAIAYNLGVSLIILIISVTLYRRENA